MTASSPRSTSRIVQVLQRQNSVTSMQAIPPSLSDPTSIRSHGTPRTDVDSASFVFQILSSDWKIAFASEALSHIVHRPLDELIGPTIDECYPSIAQTSFFYAAQSCMAERSHSRHVGTFPDVGNLDSLASR
jgi:hypothetical protein